MGPSCIMPANGTTIFAHECKGAARYPASMDDKEMIKQTLRKHASEVLIFVFEA